MLLMQEIDRCDGQAYGRRDRQPHGAWSDGSGTRGVPELLESYGRQ